MERISENLRTINMNGFNVTGNLLNDVIELCKFNGRDPEEERDKALILGLRIKLGNPMTVHVLTDSVCKKVQKVKIESLPTGYPKFLEKPFLIEAKPGSYLLDDIDAIGGFIDDEDNLILIIYSANGTFFTRTKNPFKGTRIDAINFVPQHGSFIPPADKNMNVFPFITVLALMLEAEKTPILIDHGTKKSRKRSSAKGKNADLSDWIECRIYIDAKYSSKTAKDSIPMDKEGKEKRDVHIQGFLRNQAYGLEHSLRKWIYVEDFDSTRWAKKGDKKITIDSHFK
jgi:hypothetical protein